MRIGPSLGLSRVRNVSSVEAAVRALFANNEQGFWLDPSDLSSMFQDARGTTPAAINQPVGLMLDKRQGVALGAPLAISPNPNWTDNGNGTYTRSAASGTLSFTGAVTGLYKLTFTIDSMSAGSTMTVQNRTAANGVFQTHVFSSLAVGQTYTAYVPSDNVSSFADIWLDSANFIGTLSNVSCREVKGNHFLQTTTAARPTLKGEHLLGPELVPNGDFSNGTTGWNPVNGATLSVTASGSLRVTNDATGTNFGSTNRTITTEPGKAYLLTWGRGPVSGAQVPAFSVGTAGTFNLHGSTATGQHTFIATTTATLLNLSGGTNVASAWCEVDNVSVREILSLGAQAMPSLNQTSSTGGTNVSVTAAEISFATSDAFSRATYFSKQPIKANTLYEITFTVSGFGSGNVRPMLWDVNGAPYSGTYINSNGTYSVQAVVPAGANAGQQNVIQFQCGTAGTTLKVSNVSVREITGFPRYYLEFDGNDDFLVSASNVDFSATDKVTMLAGLRKSPNAGLSQCVFELGTDSAANNGTFGLLAPAVSGTVPFRFSVKSTQPVRITDFADASLNGVATVVASCVANLLGDSIVSRINGGQFTASDIRDNGDGNFISAPVYIGRRGGTQLGFTGRLYSLIVRGAATSDLTGAEAYMNSKTGAY